MSEAPVSDVAEKAPARTDGRFGHAMLKVQGLKRYFDVSAPWLNRVLEKQPKQILKAVDGIDF